MLKIKDNIDLKELEKFGFIELKSSDGSESFGWKIETVDNEKDDITSEIYVYPEDSCYRRMLLADCDSESVLIDKLFDLIQAGLIEKIQRKR